MKKKILSICLVCCLVAVAAIGGTLAYFTDTDEATNTFTTTGVDIKLIEQQRQTVTDNDGNTTTTLVPFENGKVLYPIVGSAQGAKDEFGLPTAANYVDKIVTVQNLKADAYVRAYVAIPAALVNDGSASEDILHWNWGNKFTAAGNYDTTANPQPESADYTANMGALVQLEGTTTIEGVDYVVYYQTYNKVLTKDEVTGSAFMIGMYLDNRVDYNNATNKYTFKGNDIDFDLTSVKIPVFAVGVQSEGFTDADAAITAAFGDNYNPWA